MTRNMMTTHVRRTPTRQTPPKSHTDGLCTTRLLHGYNNRDVHETDKTVAFDSRSVSHSGGLRGGRSYPDASHGNPSTLSPAPTAAPGALASGLRDPRGRRVFFDGDFHRTPDAPLGGARLVRIVDVPRVYIQLLGDTGARSDTIRGPVLKALKSDAAARAADARVLLGDLVYENGVIGPDDPLIHDRVDPFGNDVETFLLLGNHDVGLPGYRLPDSGAYLDVERPGHTDTARCARSLHQRGAVMPGRYYDVLFETAEGDPVVQVFVLDTTSLAADSRQRRWLEKRLASSPTPNRVIAGHHPLHSVGPQHKDRPPFADWLEATARNAGVTAMFFGHEHNLQLWEDSAGPLQAIAGSGSKLSPFAAAPSTTTSGNTTDDSTENATSITDAFALGEPGFAALFASPNALQLELRVVDTNGTHHQFIEATRFAAVNKATPTTGEDWTSTQPDNATLWPGATFLALATLAAAAVRVVRRFGSNRRSPGAASMQSGTVSTPTPQAVPTEVTPLVSAVTGTMVGPNAT